MAAPNGFFGAPRKLVELTENLVQGTAEQSQYAYGSYQGCVPAKRAMG